MGLELPLIKPGVAPVAKKHQHPEESEIVGFLGVGLDNKDGHQRITRCDHFVLLGGSEETHEHMQDTAIRFNEGLERSGKRLEEATLAEIIELFYRARE
jgi:hypothetical protein